MRKLISIMVLFVGALVLPHASKADSITATATYSNSTSSTQFSAPGNTITFTFDLPAHLNVFLTELNVPISISYQGNTIAETAIVFLYANDEGGLFDLFFLAGFHSYDWAFYGSQIFDANRNLVSGSYPIDTTQSAFYKDLGLGYGTFSSGTVVVGGAAIPEPASILLLGMGFLGLAPTLRKRFGKKQA